jgi:hypothetical protein
MTVLVSAVYAGRDPRPARAVLHSYGATIEDVAEEIARRAGPGAVLFGGLDQDALAAIGIDLDAVRARIGSSFGPEALTQVVRREPSPSGLKGGASALEPGAGEEAVEEAGPVLHPPEPGLHQRGQLADVAFSQVGQGSLQVRPHWTL